MLPGTSSNHVRDGALVNAKMFGNSVLFPSIFSECYCLLRLRSCKFVVRAFLAVATKVSSNANTTSPGIRLILLICSKVKMAWIDTCASVAAVANAHTVWNRTKMKLPANSVSCHCNAINSQMAVSANVQCSKPEPTIIRTANVNLFPKPISDSFGEWPFVKEYLSHWTIVSTLNP